MGKIADPLRDAADGIFDVASECADEAASALLKQLDFMLHDIADVIDREHESRMEQCRRETRRYCLHRVRSMMNDMERGIKWARKEGHGQHM